MPLNDPVFKAALIAAMSNPSTSSNIEQVAEAIVVATKAYIQSAQVIGSTSGGATINGTIV